MSKSSEHGAINGGANTIEPGAQPAAGDRPPPYTPYRPRTTPREVVQPTVPAPRIQGLLTRIRPGDPVKTPMVAAKGYRDVVALRAQQYIPSVDEINDSGIS